MVANGVSKQMGMRASIAEAEEFLGELPQVDMPPVHYHAEGLYGREITIPAGTLLVGKIHKHASLNILLKGKMRLLTEDGVVELVAPYTVSSKAGTKRMMYAYDECIWLCVHGTQETELDKIEEDVIAKTFEDVAEIEDGYKKLLGEDICRG